MGGTEGAIREPMIEPERGGSPVTEVDIGDGAVSVELISYDSPEVTV